MEKKVIWFILLLSCFSITVVAQTKVSLNYYSNEVLDKIDASERQKSEILIIKNKLDRELDEIKKDKQINPELRNDKAKQLQRAAFEAYNKVLNSNQQFLIRRMLHAVEEENVRNGFSSFYKSEKYVNRMADFKRDPLKQHSIVFLGNSITQGGKWQELIPEKVVANRGIAGDNTYGILSRLNEVVKSKPEKIFLMIGINDIGNRLWEIALVKKNYGEIIDEIKRGTPDTKIYIQSLLPLNDRFLVNDRYKNKADTILKMNTELEILAMEKRVKYIDLHSLFHQGDNILEEKYSNDGIHLSPMGYTRWVDFLRRNKYL